LSKINFGDKTNRTLLNKENEKKYENYEIEKNSRDKVK